VNGERAARYRKLLYGRRKGPKLSERQQHLLDHLLPKYELNLRSGCDPRTYFSAPVEEVWLEVGFGGGEHLFWQAQHHSNVGIIGAEPYENGIVKLLSQLEAVPLNNVRIYTDDARDILETFPEMSLTRAFILFPDPWPKARHHKRRFIQMEMLDQLACTMRPGAVLRFASDDAAYVGWTLERLKTHPAYEWTATCQADWKVRPPDWPSTRYETKELHGKPVFLTFRRV